MQGSHAHDVLAMEFTYLVNAAIVRFGVDFGDQESVLFLCQKIKGAVNIGLEKVLTEDSHSLESVYTTLGLEKLYRLGLTELMALRTTARKVTLEQAESFKDSDTSLFSIVACAREPFPCMPMFLEDDGSVSDEEGALPTGERAIETLAGVRAVGNLLDGYLARLVQEPAS